MCGNSRIALKSVAVFFSVAHEWVFADNKEVKRYGNFKMKSENNKCIAKLMCCDC